MNYEEKDPDYFSNIRFDIIRFMGEDKKDLSIMEIGAAYGETLFYLKSKGVAKEAIGIELFEDEARKDRYKPINQFIFCDIEKENLLGFDKQFDLILLLDVLEHLIEPTLVLDKVKQMLKPGGTIVVSMPNIRHYSAIFRIFLKGDFKYDESGIFDYTHRRFYCRKNMVELLEKSNFKISKSEGSIQNYSGRSTAKLLNTITIGIFEEFFSTQYFFIAQTGN